MAARRKSAPRRSATTEADASSGEPAVVAIDLIDDETAGEAGNGHDAAARRDVAAHPAARAGRGGVRTLIVDDHAIFLAGLNAYLEAHPGISVVGYARDGFEAVQMACELEPDVVLMDVTMPGLNGVDATRQIRTRVETARILVVSMHAESNVVRRMFREGAAGYLLKGSTPGDLIRGINALADNETYLCPKAAGLLMGPVDGGDGNGHAGNFDKLTAREREVLQLIAEGNSSKEIAGTLHLSVKTIETHRSRLMRKLDLHSVAALTKLAVREGITTLSD